MGAKKRIKRVSFTTWLLARGSNTACVRTVEIGAGGDPSASTPYPVARFRTRAGAEALKGQFESCAASAEVRDG